MTEREFLTFCDSCGEPIYADQEYAHEGVTVYGETNAIWFDHHVNCEEAKSDGE